MSRFYHEMRGFVLKHNAINNSYLRWFRTGDLSNQELYDFSIEFYNFARFFPKILVAQLVNTEDELVADELTRVLYSELGEGQTENRHELLYRKFLRSIGINVHEALSQPMMPTTKAYIDGMEELYGSGNHEQALGASFGLENMATTMWDQLIPGLTTVQYSRRPTMDITYFSFHRELESTHEEAMKNAVAAFQAHAASDEEHLSPHKREEFWYGVTKVLDYLEGFWMGLERKRLESVQNFQEAISGIRNGPLG